MFESVIDPKALLSILRERHVHYISQIDARILAHLSLGYRNEEIAQWLGCTGATVRRHVADLAHRVFDPTEIEGTATSCARGYPYIRRVARWRWPN